MDSNSDKDGAREGSLSDFFLVGANHLTASVSLRDRLLLDEETARAFVESLLNGGSIQEIVVLSTCNRSEVYAASKYPQEARREVERAWGALRGISEDEIRNHGYFRVRDEAIRHLFRVIGSLDSMIIGEMQIFGQVKEAYRKSVEHRWAGVQMNRIFQAGLHAGKRIHAETSIHEGAVSISYAAVELARKVLGDLRGKTVGVVGAGEMGELAAQHFHKAGAHRFLFFNRSRGAAVKLASAFGGEALLLEDFDGRLEHCDIVVSATGAPGIVISKDLVQKAARNRRGQPIFLIDIAAPRDIDPEAGNVEGAFLFSLDDLKSVVGENVDLRRQAARNAESIIEEEAVKVESWELGLDVVPVLRALREKYQLLAEKEIGKWSEGQPPETRQFLENLGRGLLNKFLHDPSTHLKSLAGKGDGSRAGYYAELLFGLEKKTNGDENA